MSVSTQQFWTLAQQSKLLNAATIEKLRAKYGELTRGQEEQVGAPALAEWLISEGVISRYHAKVLLSGQPGPFSYGEFKIFDRQMDGRLKGLFRAVHVPTKSKVSLKFLAGTAAQDAGAIATQKHLVRNQQATRHPNLVACYSLVDLPQYKFFVLDDLSGMTLEEKVQKEGPLPPDQACRVARQVAQALAKIQEQGQVHGEVRPGNIWLNKNGTARLLHLPLSRDPLMPVANTTSDASGNKADWVAPEVAQNQSADSRSDVYSLGCVLYYMLSGQVPFPGEDAQQKLAAKTSQEVPPVTQVAPQVPPPIETLVTYLTARDPGSRYQDAAIVVEATAPYAATEPPIDQARQTACATLDKYYKMKSATEKAQPVPVGLGPQPMAAESSAAATEDAAPGPAPVAVAGSEAKPTAAESSAAASFGEKTEMSQAMEFRSRRRTGRNSTRDILIVCGGLLAVTIVAAAFLLSPGDSEESVARPISSGTTPPPFSAKSPSNPPPRETGGGPQNVSVRTNPPRVPQPAEPKVELVDDPGVLWASPTRGKPLDLRYMLPGSRIVISLRPADLLSQPEGEKFLDTSGPLGKIARTQLQKLAGTTLENMEQVLIGLQGASGSVTGSLVVRTIEPIDPSAAWENVNQAVAGGTTKFLADGNWGYYLPEAEGNKLVVVAPASEMGMALDYAQGAGPIMTKLEMMLPQTDADRQINVLFSPGFLFADGRHVFGEDSELIRDPVRKFLVDDIEGAIFSLHLDSEDFFAEMRLLGRLERSPQDLIAKDYPDGLAHLLTDLYGNVNTHVPLVEYNQNVLMKFPFWIGTFKEYTRTSVEGRQVVSRTYLPAEAAHNLALASNLATMHIGAGGAVAAAPRKPQTVREKLNQKTTLAFERNDMILCLKEFGEDIGVKFNIRGGDLQLEGITQNQAIANFNEKDKPAVEILMKLLKLADSAGRLVFVIKEDENQIDVTTKAAVEKSGEKLPAELAGT